MSGATTAGVRSPTPPRLKTRGRLGEYSETDASLLHAPIPRKHRERNARTVAGEVLHVVIERLRDLEMLVDVEFLDAGREDRRANDPRIRPCEYDGVREPHVSLPRDKPGRDESRQQIHRPLLCRRSLSTVNSLVRVVQGAHGHEKLCECGPVLNFMVAARAAGFAANGFNAASFFRSMPGSLTCKTVNCDTLGRHVCGQNLPMNKRHKWDKAGNYAVCLGCGMRYRQGVVSRMYEHADYIGGRHPLAGSCPPDTAARRSAAALNGGYYVSVRKSDGNYRLLLGPFAEHADALDAVQNTRRVACDLDPRGCWYEYGTCRLQDDVSPLPAGILNHILPTRT